MNRHCAVLDIGKTNVKLRVVDEQLNRCFDRSCPNRVVEEGLYPHHDIDGLWTWFCAALAEAASEFAIDVIVVTTHGATAALVDDGAGLALPVMDYEFAGPAQEKDYEDLRPAFSETCSPSLPAGLNLGRQLLWQRRHCAPGFDNAQHILPYPQYWAWRLTGVPVSEVTSWGCHTDLWAPAKGNYSTLVDRLGIRDRLPPLVSAGARIGTVSDAVVEQTGLSPHCGVVAGLHDSNASYLRYLSRGEGEPFTVISTGTWVVSFSASTPLESLDESRDMLANVDITGHPVACARFMGGREYEVVCQRADGSPTDSFTDGDLQQVIDDGVFALPDFSEGSGPFGGRTPLIEGRALNGAALASIYCAMMVDCELDLLESKGDLIIEGSWLRNPLLCGVLAQLRPDQRVYMSTDETGTINGAAQLAFEQGIAMPSLIQVGPSTIAGLGPYRDRWQDSIRDHIPRAGP